MSVKYFLITMCILWLGVHTSTSCMMVRGKLFEAHMKPYMQRSGQPYLMRQYGGQPCCAPADNSILMGVVTGLGGAVIGGYAGHRVGFVLAIPVDEAEAGGVCGAVLGSIAGGSSLAHFFGGCTGRMALITSVAAYGGLVFCYNAVKERVRIEKKKQREHELRKYLDTMQVQSLHQQSNRETGAKE